MEGATQILQIVLQDYSATLLRRSEDGGASLPEPVRLFNELMSLDAESEWSARLREKLVGGDAVCTPNDLLSTVQDVVEATILNMENGTIGQQVQAEFVSKLIDEIRSLQNELETDGEDGQISRSN